MIADKERLLLKIFHDYYVRNMSQAEIAARHGISRQKVQRFLSEGRRDNLVEVRIRFPERMHGALESELEDKYGLLEAIIADVDGDYNQSMVMRNISELSSDYTLRILRDNMTVSIAWSIHVSEMMEMAVRKIDRLREKPKGVKIILTLGTVVGAEPDLQTLEATRRLSSALGGDIHLLLASGMTSSSEAWRALMDDPQIADTVAKARNADAAFFGIGSLEGGSKLLDSIERIMPELLPKLAGIGVVGDVSGHLFDKDGNPVASELDERLIGLSIPEIKAMPLTIGITNGPAKYGALKAALAGNLFKVIITDVESAKKLMAEKN
ncbi:MAG: hypothetical protein LIP23_03720 [Planctomycetes bacterium]|nr:hypothetical protein [Planctomycetota bacterium]